MYHIRTYTVRMYTHFYLHFILFFMSELYSEIFSCNSQNIQQKFNVSLYFYHAENINKTFFSKFKFHMIFNFSLILWTPRFELVSFVLVQKIPVLFNQSIPSCLIFQPFFQQHMFHIKIILITLICVPLRLEGGQEVVVRTARKRKRAAGSGSESAERMHESGKAGGRVVAAQGRPASHLSAAQRKRNPRKETCRY
jgi:hypothetical protein